MLLLPALCFLGFSAAMLSKCINPNTGDLDNLKKRLRQLQIEKALIQESASQLASSLSQNKEELALCRERRRASVKNIGHLAASYLDLTVLDPALDLPSAKMRLGYFVGVGLDGLLKSILQKGPELMADIVSIKYVLHLIASFYLCPKEDIPAYYWNLRHQVSQFKEAAGFGGADERTRECWSLLHSYSARYLEILSKLFAMESALLERSAWEKIFPLPDVQGIIEAYAALPLASPEGVNDIFANPKLGLLKTDPIMQCIREDFKVARELTSKVMDTQFPSQEPGDILTEASSEAPEKPTGQPLEQQKNMRPLKEKKPVNDEKAERRNGKMEARSLKENEKHKQRVEKLKDHICISEADDQDVTYFYISKMPEANFIFHTNQSNQVCRRTFERSERYEHSLFPGLTASGATINYLCSLMVSGNPEYEGFCEAHKDLGGIFMAKKNGNKLFLFKEPISYHKTLHAPHLSSRFDHILYRRFYRNCGLHPYFFIFEGEEK